MLSTIAIVAGLSLVGAASVQWAIGSYFQKGFDKRRSTRLSGDQQKHAAVLMSVRGCDPSLENCLSGILNQDYDSYEVHLVVDHKTDPAWDFVHQLKTQHDERDVLTIHEMVEPLETCSLKCNSLIQAYLQISDSAEFVALIDSDVSPHSQWLADLTGPLQDPTVGGVTGSQWFEPAALAGIGSLARSTWNSGALVLTIFFSNPWAGSFCMRRKDLDDSGLVDTWSRTAVDDGPIQTSVNDLGLKIEFAPSLIMVNREACTFGYVNRWVTRMLTWSRLYESTFFLTVIHACFSNAVMLSNFALLFLGIATGNGTVIAISVVSLIASGVICTHSYIATRKCVQHSLGLRGETLQRLTPSRIFGVFAMISIAHLVYGVSCVRALLLKQIKWREISYELNAKDNVKRLNYAPFVGSKKDEQSSI
ncbi:MAG: glycosyltransferase [Mariniblastus sp.]